MAKVEEYLRARFDQIDDLAKDGWRPIMRDGRVVVETLTDGSLHVCLMIREVEE